MQRHVTVPVASMFSQIARREPTPWAGLAAAGLVVASAASRPLFAAALWMLSMV